MKCFVIHSIITWSWEITFIPLWIVLCISLVGVLYTIIFAGILLRMPDVNQVLRVLTKCVMDLFMNLFRITGGPRPTLPWATASS